MGEAQQIGIKKFAHLNSKILTPQEIHAGFSIVGKYINDVNTPVPNFCFIRHGYIIQGETDLSTKHNHMIEQLSTLIQKHLYSKGIEHARNYIFINNRLNTSELSEPEYRDETMPDIAVYSEPINDDLGSIPTGQIPMLILEILSPSTGLNDVTEKKTKYRDIGVKHYWVIKKSEDPNEGLEQSFFYILRGKKYYEISPDFQESGVLICEDLYNMEIMPEDVWFKNDSKNTVLRWHKAELRANQEKARADELENEIKMLKRNK
jgi:Uma2 family endonuclease